MNKEDNEFDLKKAIDHAFLSMKASEAHSLAFDVEDGGYNVAVHITKIEVEE